MRTRVHHGSIAISFAASLLACASPPAGAVQWSVAHEEPGAALLTVLPALGTILAAGADDGSGPMLLRREADAFTRVPVSARGTLWWLAHDGDAVLAVGEGGLVLALAAADATPARVSVPTDRTLFGAWVAPDGTAWAVGGDVMASAARGAMLVRRGGAWAVEDRIDASSLDPLLFKVWGRSPTDVWAVGEQGLALHFDGARWSRVDTGTHTRLLTVHGTATSLYAVGGTGNAVLLERAADGTFADRAPALVPALDGVFALEGGGALAVGNGGTLLERRDGTWREVDSPPTSLDLHAVVTDAAGEAWAVGGALFSPSLDHGVVLHGVRAP